MKNRSLLLAALGLASLLPAQVQVALGASKDNTLYEDPLGGLSNGQGHHLFVGRTAQVQFARRRGLIAFDLSGRIPAGAKIVSASLTLNLSKTVAGTVAVGLHRAAADWGEGASQALLEEGSGAPAAAGDATWVHRFHPAAAWQSPGGDFAAAPSASASVGGAGLYTWASTPGLVADVQSWLDQPAANYGWLILAAETGTTAKRFDTRENPSPSAQPRLTVVYQPPPALATPVGQGCAGSSGKPLTQGATGVPSLGNAGFALDLAGGPGGGLGAELWGLSLAQPPLPLTPGCLLFLDPSRVLLATPVVLDPAGAATLPLPIPGDPLLFGATLSLQPVILDGGAAGGLVTANALTLFLGA